MKIIHILFAFIIVYHGYAQDITVKSFELLEKDQTAAMSPRKDLNGTVCGLVRVQLKETGAKFEGNVMGDVQFTGNEYLVYMPNGSKRLSIKHPDYLPTTIVFDNYGTKKVASGTTYKLVLKTSKNQAKVDKSKNGMAVFNIKPSNAVLLIDDKMADGSSGAYTLSLPYGLHYYSVKLNDFCITNQHLTIDKHAKEVSIDLTEFFAQLEVSCETTDADIYVNNEFKGTGTIKMIAAPGKYTIEARKEGYHYITKNIELYESEVSKVSLRQLQPIVGTLIVSNMLNNCEVLIDGKSIGKTPLEKKLPVGGYLLEVRHEYYHSFKGQISIGEDQTLTMREDLKPTQLSIIMKLAEQGNSYGICMLTELYLKGSKEALQREGWGIFYSANPGEAPVYIANRDIAIKEQEAGFVVNKDVKRAKYWKEKRNSNYIDEIEGLAGLWNELDKELNFCF